MGRKRKSAVTLASLPEDTKLRNGLVLSTRERAKLAETREERRSEMYAEIERLYSDGERVADELMASPAKTRARLDAAARMLLPTKKNADRRQAAAAAESTEISSVTVRDPYEPEKALVVAKNIRTHPLDQMLARGRITDAQKAAGDRFLAIWDRSQIGGARAIDYSRVKVDVSFVYDGLDAGAMAATAMLGEVCKSVGKRAYILLVRVIGQRSAFWDMARRPDGSVDQGRAKYLAAAFRDAIDDLADHFGCAKGAPARIPPFHRDVKPFVGKIDVEVVDGKLRLTDPLRAAK